MTFLVKWLILKQEKSTRRYRNQVSIYNVYVYTMLYKLNDFTRIYLGRRLSDK